MAKPQPARNQTSCPAALSRHAGHRGCAAFSGKLRDALAAADVAAVLLRLKAAGERDLINRIKVLAPIVQGTDAALVLDGSPRSRRAPAPTART